MKLRTYRTEILAPTRGCLERRTDGPSAAIIAILVDASSPDAARSRVEASCRLTGWPRSLYLIWDAPRPVTL